MQEIVSNDVDKYKNRNIASVSILFFHNDKPTNMYRKEGIYMKVGISVFPINGKGILNGNKDAWGCDFVWRSEDFKITKFSFKLIETILRAVGAGEAFNSIMGFPLSYVLEEVENVGISFDGVLKPLAGSHKN